MSEAEHPVDSKVASWMTVIGMLLLLVGIYATVRTGINFFAFPKYPQEGVLSFNFTGTPPYFQREQDCNYPIIYYEDNNSSKERSATESEIKRDEETKRSCLQGVADQREAAKKNDISQSLLFLFLGAGLLVSRRFLR